MSIVEIVSFIVAFAAAASKLLNSAKPFWAYLPKPVADFLPSVVVMLPFLAEKVSDVHTTIELVNALVLSLALLLPGVVSQPVAKTTDKE